MTLNVCSSLRFTTSTFAPMSSDTPVAKGSPVCPPSTNALVTWVNWFLFVSMSINVLLDQSHSRWWLQFRVVTHWYQQQHVAWFLRLSFLHRILFPVPILYSSRFGRPKWSYLFSRSDHCSYECRQLIFFNTCSSALEPSFCCSFQILK